MGAHNTTLNSTDLIPIALMTLINRESGTDQKQGDGESFLGERESIAGNQFRQGKERNVLISMDRGE